MSEDSQSLPVTTTRITTLDRLALEYGLWKNPRTITGLDDKSLDELGDSLHDRGQLHALLVVKVWGDATTVVNDETGEVIQQGERPVVELVLDGQRRYLAFMRGAKSRKKGLSTVPVKVEDLYAEPIELTQEICDKLLMDMVDAAMKREGLSSFEQLEFAVHFREAEKKTIEEVAQCIRRSSTWVSRMMRAWRLASPMLIKAFRDKKVTDEMFKDLAEINPHDKQEAALKDALDQRSEGGRDAKAAVRHTVKETAAKAKEERAKAKPAKAAKADKKAKPKKDANHAPARTKSDKPMVVELVDLRKILVPSDPYVKGLMHGAAYSLGKLDVEEFSPAWRTYMKQLQKKKIAVPEALGGLPIPDGK